MNLTEFWTAWATQVALALHLGSRHMLEQLMGLALLIALSTLESLGIQYGPRLAR